MLAGAPTPATGNAFLVTYGIIAAVALVVLVTMALATRSQVRRARRLPDALHDKGFGRVAVHSLVGHVVAAGVLYAAVFGGVGALGYGGWLPLDVAFQALPDVTVVVLVAVAFLVVRGMAWLALASARGNRARRTLAVGRE
ncbi:hypothetical protein [Allokutzneria oryzae]|uniref:Uncharacterized protein n=1 Tax=Allokutzneria oryzae TaxID=1378989 RepID=A0ABV5ZUK3_9PSEU